MRYVLCDFISLIFSRIGVCDALWGRYNIRKNTRESLQGHDALSQPGYSFSAGHSVFKGLFIDELRKTCYFQALDSVV